MDRLSRPAAVTAGASRTARPVTVPPRAGGRLRLGSCPRAAPAARPDEAREYDTLRLTTLGGRDHVTIDPDAELLITPVVDLGAGQ